MDKYSIEVKNLSKYYNNIKAVDDISFNVESGIIFGMLGPNGAGKSTTIESIVGLIEKNKGTVNIMNLDLDNNMSKIRTKIGVQLQSPSLFPRLTVKEIIKLFSSFYPNPLPVKTSIEKVGLKDSSNKMVKSLSGGQKHRLAIAIAIASNADIIFLDEPTTGLDPQARHQLWDVILDLKKSGVTVFLTTHYMDEAEKLCDQLVVIDKGKIIAKGSPKDLINANFKERAVEFSDPGFSNYEIKSLIALLNARYENEKENNKIIIYTDSVSDTITKLMNYCKNINKDIDDIVLRHATLEDVFLKLTGRGIRK